MAVIISNYDGYDALSDKIDHPTLKATVKWRNHPNILRIASEKENRPEFSFNFFSK